MFKFMVRLLAGFLFLLALRSWIASNEMSKDKEAILADYDNTLDVEEPQLPQQRYDAQDENYIAEGLGQQALPSSKIDSIAHSYKRSALYIEANKNAPCNTEQRQLTHYRQKWESDQQKYQANFRADIWQGCRSEALRENIILQDLDEQHIWGGIYAILAKNDIEHLEEVYKVFSDLQDKYKLDYQAFAEMVISFVQYQPYVLVHPDNCEKDRQRNTFSEDYHDSGQVCLPYKRFGLQAPSEFMYNLQGDCDTRALFLYTVLSHFGYDVVILGSDRHAMLGINMPGQGHYLVYKGRKYYFWETTGTGWVIGAIPPIYQNDRWEITLHSLQLDS